MRMVKKIGVVSLVALILAGIGDPNTVYRAYAAAPTATIAISNTSLNIGSTATVTIAFSEAVSGFDITDLTVPNGTLSSLSSSDGGKTWTATLAPAWGAQAWNQVITLDNTGVTGTEAPAEPGTGTTLSDTYSIDTVRPTLASSITISNTSLGSGDSAVITFVFTEAVRGFDLADLTVPNGTLGNLSSNDGGITWTATLTPNADVMDFSNVLTLDYTGIMDLSGNVGSGTADSGNYAVHTTRPALASLIEISDTALKIGDSGVVTFVFTEAVAGFTAADLTVPNGTLSDLASSDGGITWTATLTPNADVTDFTNVLTLDYTGIANLAGNRGVGTVDSANYAVDTTRPALASPIAISDAALKIGYSAAVTFVFAEAISGFTAADLTIANGTLSDLASSDGGITWTAKLTPAANVEAANNVITLDKSGIIDLAGNAGAGADDSDAYDIDTTRPYGNVSLTNKMLKAGGSSEVTVTFSEAVTGFASDDLTAANGTLSSAVSSDGGRTWTATLTPNANISGPVNAIVLDNAGVMDLAGNVGTGTVMSDNYTVQTVLPTSVVTVEDSTLTAGETSRVEIVFSEKVTGFSNEDLTVENGTLSEIGTTDGGKTWTAILTPKAGVNAAANHIKLRNEGVVNAAGNAGIGSTLSNAYAVFTVPSSGSVPSSSYDPPAAILPAVDGPVFSTDGTLLLPAGRAGTVSLGEAIRIEIPAGASSKELKLTIGRVADTRGLLTNGEVLASPVFELFKSFPENLGKPVKLTLAFDAGVLKDGRRPAVFHYDETRKEWIETEGGSIQGNRISVETNRFQKYAVLAIDEQAEEPAGGSPQEIVVRDIAGHWAEHAVNRAISEGIVSGYPDGTFKPNADVTRAEFSVMLINALREETTGSALSFADSSEIGDWARSAVSKAVQAGILKGYADGSFRPNAYITRAEMAVMTARALKLQGGDPAGTVFADETSIPVWAKDSTAALKNAGVIRGTGANVFKPDARTTRAEAAVVLLNMSDLPKNQ